MVIKTSELLKIINIVKFFGQKSALDNTINYVFFYSDEVVARNLYSGVVFFHNMEITTEFGVPCDILSKLAVMMRHYDTVEILVKDAVVVWKFGKTKYKLGLLSPPEVHIPLIDTDSLTVFDSPDTFLPTVVEAEFAASQDVRQLNLCGLYINNKTIYSCDNVRAFCLGSGVFDELQDVFISIEVAGLLKSLKIPPTAFQKKDGKLFFIYDQFYIYASELSYSG